MPSLTSSRDPRQAQVPSYAGAFPSDPNEIVRLRSLYPPYSDTDLVEAKKGQLIPGEVLYCEVRAGNLFFRDEESHLCLMWTRMRVDM